VHRFLVRGADTSCSSYRIEYGDNILSLRLAVSTTHWREYHVARRNKHLRDGIELWPPARALFAAVIPYDRRKRPRPFRFEKEPHQRQVVTIECNELFCERRRQTGVGALIREALSRIISRRRGCRCRNAFQTRCWTFRIGACRYPLHADPGN